MRFRIVPYGPKDFNALWLLERQCGSRKISRAAFIRELAGPRTIVYLARSGRSLAGAVIAWKLDEEVQVIELVVGKSFRRRGAGRRLLAALFRDSSLATLEVRASNHAARALYQSAGFRTVGCRKMYYDGKEDALLMERKKQ